MNRNESDMFFDFQWDMIQLQNWGTVDASNYGHHIIRNMIAVVDEVKLLMMKMMKMKIKMMTGIRGSHIF